MPQVWSSCRHLHSIVRLPSVHCPNTISQCLLALLHLLLFQFKLKLSYYKSKCYHTQKKWKGVLRGILGSWPTNLRKSHFLFLPCWWGYTSHIMESGLSHCYAKWLEQFQKLFKNSLINGEGVGKGKTKKVFAKYCLYIFTKMQVLYRSKESGMMYGKRNVIHKSTLSLQCNPVDFNQSASIRQKDFWSHSIVTQHVLVFMLISKNIFTRWCSSAAWSKPSLLCSGTQFSPSLNQDFLYSCMCVL